MVVFIGYRNVASCSSERGYYIKFREIPSAIGTFEHTSKHKNIESFFNNRSESPIGNYLKLMSYGMHVNKVAT